MNKTTTTYSVPEGRGGVLSEFDLRVSRFLTEDTARPPAFLLGAGLLFWGWQSELIFPAIIMGLLLEGARYSTVRWEFSSEDFNRIWTFCTLLFLASLVFAFTENDGPSTFAMLMQEPTLRAQSQAGSSSARTAASIIRWLPMVFFVFLGAQVYSTRQGVPLETISLILRRRWKRARKEGKPLPPSRSVDISWIFFGLCIFGASIQNTNRAAFFWGTCFLLGWALWSQKSVRYGFPTWAAVLAVAIGLGFVGQTGFGRLQRYIENMNARWWMQMSPRGGTDSGFSRTAMGRIGKLKLSQAIVVRLETEAGMKPPPLLREASYREFGGQVWRSAVPRNEMETMAPETNQTSWVLVPGRTNGAVVKISSYLPGSRGLLPLPNGTGKLEDLPVFLLYKNPLGAVFAEGPGLVVFHAIYSPGPTVDSAPDEVADLTIPELERAAVEAVAEEMGLQGLSQERKLARLREYFEENFSYSTYQREVIEGEHTPLTRFLLRDRKGHCEFFATAAVLLCRQAGIPARYAVGYAVHEGEKGKYVIRERDAHAWCLFWNEKGRWQDFDATPPSWVEVEGGTKTSVWRKIADGWSRLKYEFSKVRWGQSPLRTYLLYALVPILAFLFYRIVFRKRKRASAGGAARRQMVWPGLDSEFYELERRLVSRGLVREPHETMRRWLARASGDPRFSAAAEPFGRLLLLHYRYRFDPEGLTAAERGELEREARSWLQQV